jgi:hypothetical protein
MPTAFLLRFQEFCVTDEMPDVQCGTKTDTRIRAEQPDTDPSTVPLAVLPRAAFSAGTMTKTSVDNEAGGRDQDRSECQMRVFADTRTRTKIKGEHSGDFAPGEVGVLAVPRSPSVAVGQTKTITAVKAEADDNDPRHGGLQAIPKCSLS